MGKGKYIAIAVFTLTLAALAWYLMRSFSRQAGQALGPERTFLAFVRAADEEGMVLDEAEWLTGQAAAAAMREDGVCPDGEPCEPPNDFYIRNSSPEVTHYSVPVPFEVTMQTWSHDEQGNYNWNQAIPYAEFLTRAKEYRSLPFYATVRGQHVVKLTEQYVP